MASNAVSTRYSIQRAKAAILYKIAGSGQRVLPLATVSNRIATQVQTATDSDMDKQFQDGLISPEAYISYLNDKLTRPGLTPSERSGVANTIRDTTFSVQETQLQSAYTSAQDNTPQKAQAAKALSDFYKAHAGATVPGTPENSDALSKASQWEQQASAISTNIGVNQRATARYQKLAEIAGMNSKDPATAMEKAQLYADLQAQALADGQVNEAAQYEAKSNTELQNAQTLTATKTKGDIISNMNKSLDMYKDGKLGAYDALAAVNEAQTQADSTGDYTLALRIDSVRKGIEDDIKANANKATSSAKKTAMKMLDSIELDISNMETAFKYGQDFNPTSDFFKQFIKGPGVPTLEDLVTLKSLAFSAEKDIATQMEDNNIPLPSSRQASIETNFAAATGDRNAFTGGRLLAAVDPATGEVKLETIQSPEEAAKYYTNPDTGLSFSLINKNSGDSAATPDQRFQAVQGGYASPEFYAGSQTLAKAGYTISVQKNGLFGIDWLAKDTPLSTNIPLYNVNGSSPDKELAVKATDVNPQADPKTYYKVTVDPANNTLRITDQKTDPSYSIDPVIVVPYQDAQGNTGLDRIYIKKDPLTGDITQYYDERRGRMLQAAEIAPILRGQGPQAPGVDNPVAPGGPQVAGISSTPAAPEAPKVVAPEIKNLPTHFDAGSMPAISPSSTTISNGYSPIQLPKLPTLTLPGANVGNTALANAFAGQPKITVPAPPAAPAGLPTYQQANDRLIKQAAAAANPKPNILQQAGTAIKGFLGKLGF